MSEFTSFPATHDPNIPRSSGQDVLMKDQNRIKKAVRQTTIVVNSRDRNHTSYPNSNHFRFTLSRPLTNVISVELINATVPSLIFTINTPWGSFTFLEGTTPFKVTLTPGYYTEAALIVELQTQLNAMVGKTNTYAVSQNPLNKVITITATNATPVQFTFLFYSGEFKDDIDLNNMSIISINSPARILGFYLNDYASTGGTIVAPLPMDLENFINRLYLHLESDGKNLARMEMGAGRQDCFHIFYLQPGANQYTFLNKDTIQSMFTSSPAPLARMANLEINIRDEFNRLAFLNYREVQLVFEITHLE